MLITTGGIIIRMSVDSISMLGRITSGVKLIDMDDDIKVAGITKVREEIEEDATEEMAIKESEAAEITDLEAETEIKNETEE